MSFRTPLFTALAVACATRVADAQITIGTTGPATRSVLYGTDPTATQRVDVGQSFVVPVGATQLTSLTVFSGATFANAGDFYLRVYRFDSALGPTGSALFVSAPFAPVASPTDPPPTVRTTVSTGALTLTPGASYFFVVTSLPPVCCARSPRLIYLDEIAPDASAGGYAGGSLYRSRSADRTLEPTALTFDRVDADLRFEATFSASVVPEPSAVLLVGAGLAGFGAVAGLRRGTRRGSDAARRP